MASSSREFDVLTPGDLAKLPVQPQLLYWSGGAHHSGSDDDKTQPSKAVRRFLCENQPIAALLSNRAPLNRILASIGRAVGQSLKLDWTLLQQSAEHAPWKVLSRSANRVEEALVNRRLSTFKQIIREQAVNEKQNETTPCRAVLRHALGQPNEHGLWINEEGKLPRMLLFHPAVSHLKSSRQHEVSAEPQLKIAVLMIELAIKLTGEQTL